MSVKTLSSVQPMVLPAGASQPRTYSIEPNPTYRADGNSVAAAAELEAFLEQEHPLGCIRGVMWVMAFNLAVFLGGLAIWECVKLLK
jgi:hypothetical protein